MSSPSKRDGVSASTVADADPDDLGWRQPDAVEILEIGVFLSGFLGRLDRPSTHGEIDHEHTPGPVVAAGCRSVGDIAQGIT